MSGVGMLILSPDGLLLRLVTDASLWVVIFYRSIFVAMAASVFLLIKKRTNFLFAFINLGWAGWSSAVLMTISGLTFVGAMANTSVANTLFILATMPFFSAILGWFFLGEFVRLRTWITITLAFMGILVIFSGSFSSGNWLGDTLATVTAFLQGLNIVVIRKARKRDVTIPAFCASAFLATLIALPLADILTVSSNDLFHLSLMGLMVVPIGLGLFLSGARYAPAAEVALLALVETVLGPMWVWLFIGEVPTQSAIIGGSIVILSVVLNTWYGVHNANEKVKH
tara:strand:- start:3649 stop:4497 length:849 start_codon:yes stop_codon:yes gene_type:complete